MADINLTGLGIWQESFALFSEIIDDDRISAEIRRGYRDKLLKIAHETRMKNKVSTSAASIIENNLL